MTRNLKALGLALIAAFALSAVAASAASAETADFSAAAYPATIDATGEPENVHVFETDGKKLTCGETVGGEKDVAVHGTADLLQESSTLTTEKESVQYTFCHAVVLGVTFPVTVDFESCDYRFTAGTKVAHGSTGTVDIVCENPGDEITITVFNNTNHDPVNNDRCVIHVPPQNDLGPVTYTNKAAGPSGTKAVTVDVNVTGITATITDTNKLGCNTETTDHEGTYTGTLWAEATNEEGEFIDSEVTGTPTG